LATSNRRLKAAETQDFTPLQSLRLEKRLTLEAASSCIVVNDRAISAGHLSMIERGVTVPSPMVALAILDLYLGRKANLNDIGPHFPSCIAAHHLRYKRIRSRRRRRGAARA
jgi:transcriptional regulator with XRE-family HTH domain